MSGCSGRDVGPRTRDERGREETVKKTDTGNLEKEVHHVVEHERQQGLRYLNKKRWEHAREYERGLKATIFQCASSDFDAVNAQK